MKQDECDWCGHKKHKHRNKLKKCLGHDYANGYWIPCPCEGFIKDNGAEIGTEDKKE